jgi:hypothetical protein
MALNIHLRLELGHTHQDSLFSSKRNKIRIAAKMFLSPGLAKKYLFPRLR